MLLYYFKGLQLLKQNLFQSIVCTTQPYYFGLLSTATKVGAIEISTRKNELKKKP